MKRQALEELQHSQSKCEYKSLHPFSGVTAVFSMAFAHGPFPGLVGLIKGAKEISIPTSPHACHAWASDLAQVLTGFAGFRLFLWPIGSI